MKYRQFLILSVGFLLLAACGAKTDEEKISDLELKIRKEEGKIKKSQGKISEFNVAIAELNGDTIAIPDTVPITTFVAEIADFEQFIRVPGQVSSKTNVMVSPEAQGTITRIPYEEGDYVRRGALIAQLDGSILASQIAAYETQLAQAQIIFEKRDRLWKQNIGSEIDWLQSKNMVENIEASIDALNSQLAKMSVYAPISGTVDEVYFNEGEAFSAAAGRPLMRIVNLSEIQLDAEVSEAHLGKIKKGDVVDVEFESIGFKAEGKVSAVGQVINNANRTYNVEIDIDNKDGLIKPNLVGSIQLRSELQEAQIMVPTRLVQSSFKGDFVYVVDKNKGIALTRDIEIGSSYGGNTVVEKGLSEGEYLVDEGFRNVADSTLVRIY
jgi:RND family efflux transporter MFP subunit